MGGTTAYSCPRRSDAQERPPNARRVALWRCARPDRPPRLRHGRPGYSIWRPVVVRDPLTIAEGAAAVRPDVEDEREGNDHPPDEVKPADRPEQDVGDRRPGQEDEAKRRTGRSLGTPGSSGPDRSATRRCSARGPRRPITAIAQHTVGTSPIRRRPPPGTRAASMRHARSKGNGRRRARSRPTGRVSSARMTERGLPSMDGAPACPFVAFGDDRDGRSTSPDHRHRCFAESPPAPRAVAHQEAYCLSSAFPVCPTFQDWARREAAHARGAGDRAETAPSAVPAAAAGRPARGRWPTAAARSGRSARSAEPASGLGRAATVGCGCRRSGGRCRCIGRAAEPAPGLQSRGRPSS